MDREGIHHDKPENPQEGPAATQWKVRVRPMLELTRPHALLALAILFAVVSQLLFRSGVGDIGRVTLTREALPTELLKLATSPPIVIGLVLYSIGFLAWLGAMSRFGLSYVYPFTSLNYVLVLLLSWLLFDEPLSPIRWIGVGVIILGIFIAARA